MIGGMKVMESLTYAEWMVMSALWGRGSQTLSEVIKTMGDKMDWSYRTYASYLNKLCEKGLAGFEARGRDRFYYADADREECIRAESRSLLRKVSERSAKELLVCMIEESGLKPADHGELKALLDELSKGSDG
jgi:BlaI family transcriptional regulator, penicillinase repressor